MQSGKEIGRYKIRRKIGAGGMGEVYLAHDAQLDRTVALKILSNEFSGDDFRRHRFKQEARAVSALNHPNILTIHEIGEAEEGYFIATEYVEGETLREYLRESSLRVVQAVRIAEQIGVAPDVLIVPTVTDAQSGFTRAVKEAEHLLIFPQN